MLTDRHTTHAVAVRRGETLLAEHRRPEDELCDTFSVTKSVVSTLVGIASDAGALALDDPVAQLLRELPVDPALTIRHLLTMTGGRRGDGPFEIDEVMALDRGWLDRIAAAPQLRRPGAAFAYDNGSVHLLAAALEAAVGEPLPAFAERVLFGPLGFEWDWPLDPEGHAFGFGHLRVRVRDLVALGELWLQRGGALLSAEYVEEATRAHTPGGPPEGDAYGFLWWIRADGFYAGGYAGQSLVVLPAHELVVVTVGAEELLEPGWTSARERVVAQALALA